MSIENLTPIRKQYLEIKRQYPDTILFFRLGDFYETFDKDAEISSSVLDIVLTSRSVAKGQRIPMAGIPFHAAENYISRLIDQGYHVAICEQVGEQPKKGLLPRQVIRIITPGTITEPGLLKSERNNYLLAIIVQEDKAGLGYIDITTGEFSTTSFEGKDVESLIRAEISRINPAEILLPESQKNFIQNHYHITTLPDWQFDFSRCENLIKDHFHIATLGGFGLDAYPLSVCACGAILQYLSDTDRNSLRLLTGVGIYTTADYMILDPATRRNLELTKTIHTSEPAATLLSVIDSTVTPMGKRLIVQWLNKPLININAISLRQDALEFFLKNTLLRAELKTLLRHVSDLERIVNRIVSQHATPRDLISLRNTLSILPEIENLFSSNAHVIQNITSGFMSCPDELDLLKRSVADDPPATLQNTGIIREGYSKELDQVIRSSSDAKSWISNLEKVEKERTGIKTLKVGYNKIFGYYIEITHTNTDLVPPEYIRKQTLVNAERYITPEMKEYETLVLHAEEQIHKIEVRVFNDICSQLANSSSKLLKTAFSLAEIDVFVSFADAAANNNYSRPVLSNDSILEIRDGRHPVVEHSQIPTKFVPNDVCFNNEEIIKIITGPNMSGKSTFLRQVALIVLMAQIGSFVPASGAKIGIVDRIFTRIGAQDEIYAGQSTFMVEMVETANILRNATSRSLLILDEIGRGTSTYDGLSIAWAVIEYIHNHPKLRARTLFATHYHELIQLNEFLPHVENFNVAVSEVDNQIVFLLKIIPGGADKSYGIHVAQLAGIPQSIIQRAHELLIDLEKTSADSKQESDFTSHQIKLFPDTNPLLDELHTIDLNSITPLDAMNKLYEWRKKYNMDSDGDPISRAS